MLIKLVGLEIHQYWRGIRKAHSTNNHVCKQILIGNNDLTFPRLLIPSHGLNTREEFVLTKK